MAALASTTVAWLDYAAISIAGLSLVVAVVFGLRNRGTAKRALALSELQESRRKPRLILHLNESVSWRRRQAEERLLGFHLLITNPTDRPTSLLKAELHLAYDVDGVITTIKVPHASNLVLGASGADVVPMDLPAHLDANNALLGWFLFRVRNDLTGGQPVDRYDVAIRDIHEVVETVQVTLFREISDEQADQGQN